MTTRFKGFRRSLVLAALASSLAAGTAAAADVNIYTSRQPALIQPLLDAFTKETGLSTAAIFIDKGLQERIAAEGANSPADVIMTVDVGNLDAAKKAGIVQPLTNETLEKNIPAEFRDTDKEWFGLTARGRVIYASKDRVKETAITYEELADPKWKGKLCTRSGQHQYNVALIAAYIAHHGEEAARTWLTGVRDNLARKPEGGDRDQAKAIAAGECDVALGNTYYVGLMQTNEKEPAQKDWAKAISVVMPTFDNGRTHVNISGIALAKNAPNKENAIKLMEYLSGDEAQRIYSEINYEYPLEPGIAVSDAVKAFGDLKPDTLPLAEIAKFRTKASELVDAVGYDDGPQS
ncbi:MULTISPECIES: Fe(3+) ABC transporter substrate-binding protein [unclassified Aureimonas]|uniref:Fe(3+) ABC transporter substrate-binding protein n=1 Tax=unclassified Aureimonas TaxID=2615206 RepID=UPI0006F9264F|nr:MULTISPECIES: Fe(3+) ABC transporter substrate-binding protein [unclassified Aureimonas]KQT69780.1 iron ABC transporter substrate-binding protein [Aureimonas sp. Leaf427]KQT76068.1 iron ABC transporter substrate-binding protein [Aureimonas sp. Leaf460]